MNGLSLRESKRHQGLNSTDENSHEQYDDKDSDGSISTKDSHAIVDKSTVGKKYFASVSVQVSVLTAWTRLNMKSLFILVPMSAKAVIWLETTKECMKMKGSNSAKDFPCRSLCIS